MQAPNIARAISYKVWNFPVEYSNTESKHDTKEFEGNMFDPMLKENVRVQKRPRRMKVHI